MSVRIDLHLHSLYSDDGEFTPAELVEKCREKGIGTMAIADHNCVRAHAEGKKAAAAAGIRYLPAIEIDCTYRDVNLHVLGYGIDYESADFAEIENQISKQSAAASRQMLSATRRLGFDVTENDMTELAKEHYWKDRWTGEMFAEVLLSKPEYREHPLLLPYRSGGTRGDNPFVNFYWDFYSQGKTCHTGMEFPDFEKIVAIIHRNGGLAVLAHPGVNLLNHGELLQPMIRAGLDGIEAFCSYHTPEQSRSFYDAVGRNRLFATCGSDFHGKTKPSIQLGGHGCTVSEDEIICGLKKLFR